MNSFPLHALLTGSVQPYTRPGSRSGIAKQPRLDKVWISPLGLEGDAQGDLRVHGGPDKAVHHYDYAHYTNWLNELGPLPVLQQPGAFGENLSTAGLSESNICLGDRFQLGGALLEVSQSRQPCWKLNDRFNVPNMAKRVQDSGRTGWYYRVLRPGLVHVSDVLTLVERPHPAWPLQRINHILYTPTLDPDQLRPMLELPLVPSHHKLALRRLEQGQVEDWTKRIEGPEK